MAARTTMSGARSAHENLNSGGEPPPDEKRRRREAERRREVGRHEPRVGKERRARDRQGEREEPRRRTVERAGPGVHDEREERAEDQDGASSRRQPRRGVAARGAVVRAVQEFESDPPLVGMRTAGVVAGEGRPRPERRLRVDSAAVKEHERHRGDHLGQRRVLRIETKIAGLEVRNARGDVRGLVEGRGFQRQRDPSAHDEQRQQRRHRDAMGNRRRDHRRRIPAA